jgi:cell division septation protein DedD
MKSSKLIVLLSVLFSPVLTDAQSRSLEEQQAISHISQAEYYTRMTLRSLEASEKIGKAPYFNYQNAREDIEKVLSEFKTYLKGDESTDLPAAVPLIVDGRYFAASIRNFLATQKTEEEQAASNLPKKNNDSPSAAPQSPAKTPVPMKKTVADKESKVIQQNAMPALPSPVLAPQNNKTKKDKIEEILKKGL